MPCTVVALALTTVACTSGGGQTAKHVPAAVFPEPPGTVITVNRESPPEGAGGDYSRLILLTGNAQNEHVLLGRAGSGLVSMGWDPARCVTPRERCFTRNGYFVAMAAAHGAPPGYLSPITSRPQVAVVVEPLSQAG